jgi:bleomycin hydrolase
MITKRVNFQIGFLLLLILFPVLVSISQEKPDSSGYIFTKIMEIKSTPVKNQYHSGTCWSFATTSFIETEMLRMGKPVSDISEMFFVRYAYLQKADRYVRFHGQSNFGQGGQAHDEMNVVKEYGMMPDSLYNGLVTGETKHDHNELDAVLKGFIDAVIHGHKLTPVWRQAFNSILDAYLGKVPDQFMTDDLQLTPKSYSEYCSVDAADYIELTSYTHRPFYQKCILEIPDNWSGDEYYNVPLDDFMTIIDNALENGYSVCWDGDVSDKGFSHKNGVAIVPELRLKELSNPEKNRWEAMNEKERDEELYSFKKPGQEKNVTQELRQKDFDNYGSTDDHLMHITGITKDQNGTKYYITKNSWSAESNKFGGYLNLSESYVRLNTIAILVNKDAIPARIAKKIGIK